MRVSSKTSRRNARKPATRTAKRSWTRRAMGYGALLLLLAYGWIALSLLFMRWVDPPTTAVQMERRTAAIGSGEAYEKRFHFVELSALSPHLMQAVVAAEDARFYSHHGFDWKEMRASVDKALDGGKPRGASTITQQLVRNLFLSTQPSIVRKAIEFSIVPFAEAILSKRRILELYLNVIEWGPGVYGGEAAARFYFHGPAAELSREQAVQLAAILPAPLHRRPGQVEWYAAKIRARMRQMGW